MSRDLLLKSLVVLMVFVTLAVAPVETAQANHSGRYTVTAVNGVRMRARPTTASRTIRIVPSGARVSVLTHSGSWLKFSYGGNTGWTRQEFLRKGYIAPAQPTSPSAGLPLCFATTFGDVACAPRWVADNIAAAGAYYGISYYTLMSLAACESSFNYNLVEWSGATGLYQWLPSTWAWLGSGSIWSVHDQAWSTARALATGYASHWVCYYRI